MLQCLTEVQLKEALAIFENGAFTLNPNQWNMLPNILCALKPFYDLTHDLSSDSASISDIIPLVKSLMGCLETTGAQEERFVVTMREHMLAECKNKRFKMMETNRILLLATLLDPRYKVKPLSPKAAGDAKTFLLEELNSGVQNVAEADIQLNRTNNEDEMQPPAPKSLRSVLNEMLSDSQETNQSHYSNSNKKKMLEYYLNEPLIPDKLDPLEYWKLNKHRFPQLAELARKYLCSPPTSVASERLFSALGIIYTPLRNRLGAEKADQLQFVKQNLALLNFSY